MEVRCFSAETFDTENTVYKDIHTSVMEKELETLIT